jgi:hypothetical protein
VGIWDSLSSPTKGLPVVAILVETDDRSRLVLPGHSNQKFLMQENEDGSLLLQPALVITEAQSEYDTNPELRALLTGAANSKRVIRARKFRTE